MTAEHMQLLKRINEYAEKALGDIDPQKTKISVQLEALKPIMAEIAKEKNMSLEDVFILYMDLASEYGTAAEDSLQNDVLDGESKGFSDIANRLS